MPDAAAIGRAVQDAIGQAATRLRPDVRSAMAAALEEEPPGRGRLILEQLLANDGIADTDGVPVCQDTGTVWVWLQIGVEDCLSGDVQSAVDEAVRVAYREGALRYSVARDALTDRSNTGDNTPAFLDITQRPGTGATVRVMLKGGGSDNASALMMLPPSAGQVGVEDAVVEHVVTSAAFACPPVVVGVGVGGTFDSVAKLAKKALLRRLDEDGPKETTQTEARMLERINASGVGPGGLGGRTTALGVHVISAPCHIAALPVAVNVGCCAMRTAEVTLT